MRPSELQQLLARATEVHQRGGLAEAERLYAQVLQAKPDHSEARRLLGVLRSQQAARTLELIAGALKADPRSAAAHANYGIVLHRSGRPTDALASFDRALALRPDNPDALNSRGNVLSQLSRHDEALASYDRALALRGDYAEAHFNRGNVLMRLERFGEALTSYEAALRLRPHPEVLCSRGDALSALKHHDEALVSYDQALGLGFGSPDLFYNRGNVFSALKRHEEALASYDRALALRRDFAEALDNRGNALRELRRHEEAIASYDAALAIRPGYAGALNNRGTAFKDLKRYDEALASYDAALAISPDFVDALYNRANALKEVKRYDEAVVAYEQARTRAPNHPDAYGYLDAIAAVCDWTRAASVASALPGEIASGNPSVMPFALLAYSDDPALQLQCARNYIKDAIPDRFEPLWKPGLARHDKIRIAYVSANFRAHPMAYLMAPLFERHDRSRFEVSGVSLGPDDGSDLRGRIVRAFDRFHDVRSNSDAEVARLINDLETDIVIDLQGYTQDCRPGIVARRPAPVQASYLGYPGTLGADFIDYVIADKVVAPSDQQAFFTEKLVHLPGTYYVTDSQPHVSRTVPSRSEAGLPEQGFVFCCFNNNYKINPPVFDVWMRLLKAVAGSVLWLLRDNAAAESNLRREARVRGVDPSRLVFAGRVPHDEHLARHRLADLFLDTLPYNAHTTATDALWIGLPVVTCCGKAFASRVAASVLLAVGLGELVTHTLQDYETLALRLATDASLLAAVREKLTQNRQTYALFDSARFCRNIEAAYTTMWEICQRGEVPRAFAVDAG